LSDIDSIGSTSRNNQIYYFVQKPFAITAAPKDSKRKTSSPLVSQVAKRSRSAPDNEELSDPHSEQPRQARSVRFKDQQNKPTKSRSKSENRSQRILVRSDLSH
jgi:hypothetical protein